MESVYGKNSNSWEIMLWNISTQHGLKNMFTMEDYGIIFGNWIKEKQVQLKQKPIQVVAHKFYHQDKKNQFLKRDKRPKLRQY